MQNLRGYFKTEKIYGFSIPMMALFCIIGFVAMYTGALGSDMMSTITFTLVLGLVLNKIGDWIPWANKNIGAGLLLCMFVPSFFVYCGVIKEGVAANTSNFFSFGGVQYMTFFIVLLMTNSMLNIHKDVLLKCIAKFIPLLLITIIGSITVTAIVGRILGVSVSEAVTQFVFPILGSGTSGAAALSQIYQTAGGASADAYYSSAVVNVVLGSTLCIFFAILLNVLGAVFPKLTGDKKSLIRSGNKNNELAEEEKGSQLPKASLMDIASGLMLSGVIYVLSGICSTLIPSVKGIELHQYAYMVVFLAIINCTNMVPDNIKAGIKSLTSFCVGLLMPMICVCIGISLMKWDYFMSAFTLQTLILTLTVIISACFFAGVFGHLFGLYAVDSAITAALCQADMGGGADIGILTPSDRMGLIAYATVASRIGYAIILILASIIFPMFT